MSSAVRWRDARALTVATVTALTLVACGGDDDGVGPDPGEEPVGSFSATISGDVSASLSGEALHGETVIDDETGDQGWVAVMGFQETETTSAIMLVRLAGRPGPGTYSLDDLTSGEGLDASEWGAFVVVATGGQSIAFSGFSTTGTVTITSSSADHVEGSFTIQATGFASGSQTELSVTAQGEFEAVGTPALQVPSF